MAPPPLSLVALFDDYVRKTRILLECDNNEQFLVVVKNLKQWRQEWKEENLRMKMELDKSIAEVSKQEKMLARARTILHEEQARAVEAENQRDELLDKLTQVQDALNAICREGGKLANETKQNLDKFLNTTQAKLRISTAGALYPRLESIDEINSTGDLLSDLSCSQSDLDLSDRVGKMKKARLSEAIDDEIPNKRRRSARLSAAGEVGPETKLTYGFRIPRYTSSKKGSPPKRNYKKKKTIRIKKSTRDHLVATTTVTVPHNGPVTACSRIETIPNPTTVPPQPSVFVVPPTPRPQTQSSSDSDAVSTTPYVASVTRGNFLNRNHEFSMRTLLRSIDECCVCFKTMGFAAKVVKCNGCKAEAHVLCREGIPLPCIPLQATPRVGRLTHLADMCGTTPPYVPPLVVRCVMEVERRGLTELGIYRVPGSEKDVRALKAQLIKRKGTAALTNYDIHVICGVLKDFFRSLPEPVITYALWWDFAKAVRESSDDRAASMYQIVSQLPIVNRHTLAFVLLHLLKVSESPLCSMTRNNLAIVFGPTLVAYSSANLTNSEICSQTSLQPMIVETLLELGEDYWQNLLEKDCVASKVSSRRLFATPSK